MALISVGLLNCGPIGACGDVEIWGLEVYFALVRLVWLEVDYEIKTYM